MLPVVINIPSVIITHRATPLNNSNRESTIPSAIYFSYSLDSWFGTKDNILKEVHPCYCNGVLLVI